MPLGRSGFTLIEIVVAASLTSVVTLGMTYVIQHAGEIQFKAMLEGQLGLLTRDVLTALEDPEAWTNTVVNGSAGGGHPSAAMDCLKNGGNCMIAGAAITNRAFALVDRQNQVVLNSINPAAGFTSQGTSCGTFSPGGNDECPFRYELSWSARCVPPDCTNPLVKISVRLDYRPSRNRRVINPNRFSFQDVFLMPPVATAGSPLLLSGCGTWTVPADWDPSNNSITTIGGGGGGGGGSQGPGGPSSGGGGGAYARVDNVSLIPGTDVGYCAGAGGGGGTCTVNGGDGGETFFCSATDQCTRLGDINVVVGAAGGQGGISAFPSGFGGGLGATAGQGVVVFGGGHGMGAQLDYTNGSGGGGAGGPGGFGQSANDSIGGSGGWGIGGSGGLVNQPGGSGTDINGSVGSGGGGGGGSAGNGGLYGGGGGGSASSCLATGGSGGNGVIVIRYGN
jgi:uncharacterized membrane protein YgcG